MSATETAIFQKILTSLAGQQVSDLHLRAGSQPVVRRDGELEILSQEEIVTPDFLDAVLANLLTPQQRATLESDRQVTIGYTFMNRMRLRITAFYQRGLPELAIRFLPTAIKNLSELGLPKGFASLITADHGLVIIAGTYGSGRTTTLTACLQSINHNAIKHIATVEEPIEYMLLGEKSIVDQREVGTDVASWEEAVESLPREDVDVVGFSRLPNATVTASALSLALGGKLVFAVMEAESCVQAVEQLVATFPPTNQTAMRSKLADALLAISVQKLVPRVGGGRVLVCELLIATPAVRALIRDGKDYQLTNLLLTSREEGMVAFDRSLAELVRTGEVMQDVALNYALDREVFQSILRR
jgi:twitching motility protein PilT